MIDCSGYSLVLGRPNLVPVHLFPTRKFLDAFVVRSVCKLTCEHIKALWVKLYYAAADSSIFETLSKTVSKTVFNSMPTTHAFCWNWSLWLYSCVNLILFEEDKASRLAILWIVRLLIIFVRRARTTGPLLDANDRNRGSCATSW